MINTRRSHSIMVGLLGLLVILGSGGLHTRLIEARRANHLSAAEPLENAPPFIAFATVALGGFRGLAADMLWLRVSHLQERDAFPEIVHLSGLITRLQPRFADVWAYHAWNMAYNVSFAYPRPDDRWRWIEHGISLLRDDALRYNPYNAKLYTELSWLYQHKLAGDSDRFAPHYRRKLAAIYGDVLGHSVAAQQAALTQPEIRARVEAEFHLDPEAMQSLAKIYGNIDWRAPESHALYWGSFADRYASGKERFRASRAVFHALLTNVQRGRVLYAPELELYAAAPNLDLLEGLLGLPRRRMNVETARGDSHFYGEFLAEAARVYYTAGDVTRARQLHRDLLREAGPAVASRSVEEMLLNRYIRRSGRKASIDVTEHIVQQAFAQQLHWTVMGETELAVGHSRLAQMLWQTYTTTSTEPDVASRISPLSILYGQVYAQAANSYPEILKAQLPPPRTLPLAPME